MRPGLRMMVPRTATVYKNALKRLWLGEIISEIRVDATLNEQPCI